MNPKVDRDASHVHKKDDSLLNNDNADEIQSRRICLNTNARSGLPIFKWDKELKKGNPLQSPISTTLKKRVRFNKVSTPDWSKVPSRLMDHFHVDDYVSPQSQNHSLSAGSSKSLRASTGSMPTLRRNDNKSLKIEQESYSHHRRFDLNQTTTPMSSKYTRDDLDLEIIQPTPFMNLNKYFSPNVKGFKLQHLYNATKNGFLFEKEKTDNEDLEHREFTKRLPRLETTAPISEDNVNDLSLQRKVEALQKQRRENMLLSNAVSFIRIHP